MSKCSRNFDAKWVCALGNVSSMRLRFCAGIYISGFVIVWCDCDSRFQIYDLLIVCIRYNMQATHALGTAELFSKIDLKMLSSVSLIYDWNLIARGSGWTVENISVRTTARLVRDVKFVPVFGSNKAALRTCARSWRFRGHSSAGWNFEMFRGNMYIPGPECAMSSGAHETTISQIRSSIPAEKM